MRAAGKTSKAVQKAYLGSIEELVKLVGHPASFHKLLSALHSMPFYAVIPRDMGRESDGEGLRYRLADEMGVDEVTVRKCLDIRPASVLEVLAAMALRCEDEIMFNPDYGDRTGKWFWLMIESLGLDEMDDTSFDEEVVKGVITRFLERQYAPNGKGGPFYFPRCLDDMREIELWQQMCWYCNDILQEELDVTNN